MVEPCAMPSFEPWETPVERLRPPVSFSLEPLRFLPLQATRTSLGSSDSRSPLPSSWTHSSSALSLCLPLRCFSVAGTGGRRRCLPSPPARPRQTGSSIPAGPRWAVASQVDSQASAEKDSRAALRQKSEYGGRGIPTVSCQDCAWLSESRLAP